MSKEKECKCCHEWWHASEIKEELCPNCYDYFKQLKQQLEKKGKDKTQLAIQELEKVKKWVADHTQDFWNCENDDLDTELYELIDNQIKELKGE